MNMNEQQILCWKCGNTFDMLTKIKHRVESHTKHCTHTNFQKSFSFLNIIQARFNLLNAEVVKDEVNIFTIILFNTFIFTIQ